MPVLDLAAQLINRLIQLRTVQIENKRKFYSDYIGPLFEDMVKVHTDYMQIFTTIANKARTGGINPNDLVDLLQEKRLELEPLRVEIRANAEALMGLEISDPATAFIENCLIYFVSSVSNCFEKEDININDDFYKFREQTQSAYFTEKVKTIVLFGKQNSTEEINKVAAALTETVRYSWDQIVASHAIAKINLLSPETKSRKRRKSKKKKKKK